MAGTNIKAQISSTLFVREVDESGLALTAVCTGTPPTTAGIFQHGCLITQTDSGSGNKSVYENTGTTAVPVWDLVGSISAGEISLANGQILIGNASNIAAANAVTGDVTISNTGVTAIGAGKVLLAMLGAGITPSHIIKLAGTTAAYGGGGTSNAFTVTGLLATDIVSAVIRTSTNAVAIAKAVPTANTLTITFTADPGAGTTVDYIIARAAA